MGTSDQSRQFQEVLAGYLEAKERGERVDPQALKQAHPELAAELDEYFANEKQFASAAGIAGSPSPPTPLPGGEATVSSNVGDYEILGEIARGGMGVVYRARHRSLGRLVALKMMLAGEFAGREGLRRFDEEAKMVAGLDHASIVPIYEHGIQDGQAFYAMKLIDGPSLKDEIDKFVGKPEDAVRLIIQVARAVHHAHQRGVLHRDLKPGNILLQFVEPKPPPDKKAGKKDYPISGIPKSAICDLRHAIPFVTDFGLAKRFQSDGKASQSTAVVGTASYMAPEQATGREALTVAADVYSLGAILYELLTGQKPFTGDNPMEVLLKVVNDEPPSPLTVQPLLDPDLAQICLKCLRKKPQERYGSAAALAEELSNWLEGETLTVRAPTMAERTWRWGRRHPIATGMLGVVVLSAAGLSGLSWHLGNLNADLENAANELKAAKEQTVAGKEAERQALLAAEKAKEDERVAKEAERIASAAKAKSKAGEDAAREESRRLLVQQYLTNGQQILQRGDVFGGAIWFAQALEQEPDDPMHRIRLGAALRQCPPLEQMWFFDGKVRLLRLSPGGERILIGVKADEAILYDTKTGRPLGSPLRHEGGIAAAEFSPDGQWLATAGADGLARLVAATDAAPHGNPLKHAQSIHAVAFSADSGKLATASADKTARVWTVATTKPVAEPFKHDREVRLVAFHPEGKKLLTVAENSKSAGGELRVWDLAKHEKLFGWPDAKKDKETVGIIDAGFSRNGNRLYAVTSGRRVRLWDAKGNSINPSGPVIVKGDAGNWFSPAVDRLIQPADSDLKLIELPSGQPGPTVRGVGPIDLAQFSPGGKFIGVTSASGGVRLIRADTALPYGPFMPHGAKIAALAFSHNDQWLATASDDRIVRLWNLAWPERERSMAIPKSAGTLVAGSPDGRYALIATPQSNPTPKSTPPPKGKTPAGIPTIIWDIEQGKTVGAALPPWDKTSLTRWSADGSSIAVAVLGEAKMWEIPGGKSVPPSKEIVTWARKLQDKKQPKMNRLLDCDGQRLAVWKNKGPLEIYDVSGAMAKTLKLTLAPELLRFSPDRRHAAAGFADGSLRVFDLLEGKPATAPFWHGEPIRQISYSADGRLLASAGASGRVRVWDAAAGQALSGDLLTVGPLVDLAFRADGKMLSAWTESRLHRWSLAPATGSPAELLRRCRLAASEQIDANRGVLIPLDAAALQALWFQERPKAP